MYCFVIILDITRILKETVNDKDLYDYLCEIADKWYEIGLSLQVHRSVLENLRQSLGYSCSKLRKVIECWKKSTPSSLVTWETVIHDIQSYDLFSDIISNVVSQRLKYGK